MIRGLIVDAGGVLVRAAPPDARRAWEAARGRPPGFLDQALREAIGPGWAGGRTEAEIEAALARLTGVAENELAELLAVLAAHEQRDEAVVELVTGYRDRCRTAVLSNAGPRRRAELVERFGLDTVVDHIVISAEEGLSKPDPRLYELTAARLGVPARECVFVDDDQDNVDGAARAGMVGIRFEDPASLAVALRRHIAEPSLAPPG